MKSMRTITDEMARLLMRTPVNGVSKHAWQIATVLKEYEERCSEEDGKERNLRRSEAAKWLATHKNDESYDIKDMDEARDHARILLGRELQAEDWDRMETLVAEELAREED